MADIGRRKRELLHLTHRCLSKLLSAVSQRHIPKARQPIDKLATVRISKPCAFSGNPDEWLFVIIRMKLGMNEMFLVGFYDFIDIERHDCYSRLF
jgi:hypothetical protein